MERLLDERRGLIADYRELLANDEERAAYDQMIALAHRVFPYVEGHKFYCEHWYTNLFFNKIRSFGALLAAHGFFANAEDVFHLTHYELESAIIDLMNAWSSGSEPRGPAYWPPIVAEFVGTAMLLLAIVLSSTVWMARQLKTHAAQWDRLPVSTASRVVGGVSILCWVSIVLLGRWIAYTQ